MSISLGTSAFVDSGGQTIDLSSMFTISGASSNPKYLVVTGLDRNEYTAGSTAATGTLSGNGATDQFVNIDSGDDRGVGIVFTYQASTGSYYNATYGNLNSLTYTSSTNNNDVTNLSLFGTNSLTLATKYADDPYSLIGSASFLGSVTVATQTGFTGSVPTQATPDSLAAVAMSFVGKAWNMNGCWTLASTISAEAGASLPVDSTMVGVPGQANGEWIVAFDGSKQSGNWQSMVKEGEIVVIGNSSTAHITTCVSGSGSSAMLVDNITYINSRDQITNSANDGSASDVLISAPHAASQEWAGISTSDVKIYELDTPVVSTLVANANLALNGTLSLAQLVGASDPAGKSVTQYQIYDSATSDGITVNGVESSAHSAATAVTCGSLSGVTLDAGSTAGTDTVDVRAFNGSYWGDWEATTVTVVGSATAPSGPTLANLPTDCPAWQIFRLYEATLGRAPDQSGFNYWINILNAGTALTAVAKDFVSSQEFQADFGTNVSSTTLVTEMYQNVLGRHPDAGGLAFWVSQISQGMTTSQLVTAFTESAEGINVLGAMAHTGGYDLALVA